MVTVEEGQLMTGFGSAVLEAANDAGLSTAHVHRLGMPDSYVEHGERGELLADLGLDAAGIARAFKERTESIAAVAKKHPTVAKAKPRKSTARRRV